MNVVKAKELELLFNLEQKLKAKFTLKSKATGKDFTYSLFKSDWGQKTYLQVAVEIDYLNFMHVGYYSNGVIKKRRKEIKTLSAKAIAWALRNIERGNFALLEDSVEIYHLGNCLRCGRVLTDAKSIEIGLGPVCRS